MSGETCRGCRHAGPVLKEAGKRGCIDCFRVDGEVRGPFPADGKACEHFEPGRKETAGKLDWTLFPFDGAEAVIRVLEYGATKYARDNWRSVPNGITEYKKAALRHLVEDVLGERKDPESGQDHVAHAACCLLFVLALRKGGG